MKNEHDLGYFGKGTTGYAHYMQTYNQCFPGNKTSRTCTNRAANLADLKERTCIFLCVIGGLFLVVGMLFSSQYIAGLICNGSDAQDLIEILVMFGEIGIFVLVGSAIIKSMFG